MISTPFYLAIRHDDNHFTERPCIIFLRLNFHFYYYLKNNNSDCNAGSKLEAIPYLVFIFYFFS